MIRKEGLAKARNALENLDVPHALFVPLLIARPLVQHGLGKGKQLGFSAEGRRGRRAWVG